ncbi:TERF1-interacting nuclear factor 2 [Erpetoichthys calabaricus]|uniref:TERF1-interacting nuclear factor 2 n=1 Tax=Erpetoichthys calabaricus TaxID=27687 RepID=UPI0022341344|nr:TERF1-interacting nuclear factor 2 [Erpetoichthys calabaricus]
MAGKVESTAVGADKTTLSLAAVQFSTPPLRITSAALWLVMKHRDTRHYGKLIDFVDMVCDAAPEILSYRHRAKLTLGLRAKIILEKMVHSACPADIEAELERVGPPSVPSDQQLTKQDKKKVLESVENFKNLILSLVKCKKMRSHYLQNCLHVEYGEEFLQALEKLLWEFLVRLDETMSVPNFNQVVSTLNELPEELQKSLKENTDHHLFKNLLHYHKTVDSYLGDQEIPHGSNNYCAVSPGKCSSQSPENSFSGLQPAKSKNSMTVHSEKKSVPCELFYRSCNKKSPSRKSWRPHCHCDRSIIYSDSDAECDSEDHSCRSVEKQCSASCSLGRKPSSDRYGKMGSMRSPGHHAIRKSSQLKGLDSIKCNFQNISAFSRNKCCLKQCEGCVKANQSSKKSGKCLSNGSCCHSSQDHESNIDYLQKNLAASCLSRKPIVLIHRLDFGVLPSNYVHCTLAEEVNTLDHHDHVPDLFTVPLSPQKRQHGNDIIINSSKVWASSGKRRKLEEKENCFDQMELERKSTVPQEPATVSQTPLDISDDVILDSEDEMTKSFKSRLFFKRYQKTKYNTFIPTLKEFLKPVSAKPQLN